MTKAERKMPLSRPGRRWDDKKLKFIFNEGGGVR